MKKPVAAVFMAVLMSVLTIGAIAADTADVYVTISDNSLRVAAEKITVTDADNDGALTINDALILAHDAKYEGGSEAGYATVVGDYGLAMKRLWGVENGTGYGYYINNTTAMNLTDTIKDGDYVNAFIYTDTTAFSDVFCFFDVNTLVAAPGKDANITLTLSAAGYDENWAPVVKPVEGATITINGAATDYKTDADGKVIIALDITDDLIISAVSDTVTLVPPVCKVIIDTATISEDTAAAAVTSDTATDAAETEADIGSASPVITAPQTADAAIIIIGAAVLACVIAAFLRKNAYGK